MAGEATRQMEVARLLEPGPCLTTEQLAAGVGCARHDISEATGKLVRRGWVDRLERGCFVLSPVGRQALAAGEVITSGPTGPISTIGRRPKRRTVTDKMWATIRISKKISLAQLEQMAGATTTGARRYVRGLVRAGYLVELRRETGNSPFSNGFKRWTLIDDPGAATPLLQRDGRIFDPNRKEIRGTAQGGAA